MRLQKIDVQVGDKVIIKVGDFKGTEATVAETYTGWFAEFVGVTCTDGVMRQYSTVLGLDKK